MNNPLSFFFSVSFFFNFFSLWSFPGLHWPESQLSLTLPAPAPPPPPVLEPLPVPVPVGCHFTPFWVVVMEQAAYISRLEKAIMQSSEAMSVLRQENAALLKINEQLKQRNVILEEEVNDLRHKSQPNTSARQSTRYNYRGAVATAF